MSNRDPKTQQVLDQVDEVKGIMHQNIDVMLANHERVEDLQDKTDVMATSAQTFKKQATKVKNVMWWKNCKLTLIIILVVLLILAVIIIAIVVPLVR